MPLETVNVLQGVVALPKNVILFPVGQTAAMLQAVKVGDLKEKFCLYTHYAVHADVFILKV